MTFTTTSGRGRERNIYEYDTDWHGRRVRSPLRMEDAIETSAPPVRPRQGEDGPQVIKGDVALGERTHQPGLLEGGPLLLQGPCATQVSLKSEGSSHLTDVFVQSDFLYTGTIALEQPC